MDNAAASFNSPMLIFVIGQTIALLIGIGGVYVGLMKQLTRMEESQKNTVKTVGEHRADHKTLETQVQGISRRVERHSTILDMPKPGA